MRCEIRTGLCIVIGVGALLVNTAAWGQTPAPAGQGVIDHPVLHPATARSVGTWTRGAGAWGESTARELMRLRGYEIHVPKLRGDHGIDLIAIRRDGRGAIRGVRIIEVKTHRGAAPVRMSQTARGPQMSRQWLAAKLRAMRTSSDPAQRTVALEIARFRRNSGVGLEMLGEVHDINTRTGQYIIRDPITGEVRSRQPLDRLFHRLQARGTAPWTRDWATRHWAAWDQIRATSLHGGAASAKGRSVTRSVAYTGGGRLIAGRLVRVAGPVGAGVALAVDGHEMYSDWRDYRRGEISREQLLRTTVGSGGGIAGAGAGALTGAALGKFGGPLAPATVSLGMGVGGVIGYFVGSMAGTTAAAAWFDHLEEAVKEDVDRWLIATTFDSAHGLSGE